ncbi:MAG: hypothetical protein U1D30_19155 [Planctomycetota bacterium]
MRVDTLPSASHYPFERAPDVARPQIELLPGGGFVVLFDNDANNGTSIDIYARQYDANGLTSGAEFLVSSSPTSAQFAAAIALGVNGDGVVAWIQASSPNGNLDVYARRIQDSDRPTTTGIEDVTVSEDADDTVLFLENFFDDAQDGPSGLTYSAKILESLAPFQVMVTQDHHLVLRYHADGWGGPIHVSVRATDSMGQFVEATFAVDVLPVNDAPILAGANELDPIYEDDVDNAGTLLADILADQVSDVDGYSLPGVAVIHVDNQDGDWQFTTNGGDTWQAFGDVSEASALLLFASDTTRVRFRPNPNFSGRPAGGVTFRAWDAYPQDSGRYVDTRENGGLTRFSSELATMTIHVLGVNDAPLLDGSNDFDTIPQYAFNSAGTKVADLIAGHVTDADAESDVGIAVVGSNEANGTWEYSRDGGVTWQAFGNVSNREARLLGSDENNRIRFVPQGDFVGYVAAGIVFVAWDGTRGESGGIGDASELGGDSPFSEGIGFASILVVPRNLAPHIFAPESASGIAGSTINVGPIWIADLDAGENPLEVTLWVTHGTFSLADLEGLEFLAGDGINDQSMRFFGTLPNINQALANVAYKGNTGFAGSDALHIDVDDLTGWSTGTSDSAVVALSVQKTESQGPDIVFKPIGPFLDGPQSYPKPKPPGVPLDNPKSTDSIINTAAPGDPWTPVSNTSNSSRGGRDLGAGSMQFLEEPDIAEPVTAFRFEPMDATNYRQQSDSGFGLTALQFRDEGMPKTLQQMLDGAGGWGMFLSQASAIGEGDDNVALVEKLLGSAEAKPAESNVKAESLDRSAVDAFMSGFKPEGSAAAGKESLPPAKPITAPKPSLEVGSSLNPSEGAVFIPFVLGAGVSLRRTRRRRSSR